MRKSAPETNSARGSAVWLMLGLAILVIIALCLGAETISAPGSAKSGIAVINVVDYGAVPNDSKDDTAAVTAAIGACAGSATKTLYFPGGTFNLATTTFPTTINVVIADGALLEIQSEATATFNGPFTAGLYRVFSGTGSAQFGAGTVSEVYPQWWGASAAGTNASPFINKAINSSPLLPGVNVRLSGTFNCQTTIHVNRDRVNLIGNGMYATKLIFNPAAPLPLFEFAKADKSLIVQCAIRDMALYGAGTYGDTARVRKIGIKLVDASITEVRNIAITNWGGNQSIGLQIQGREMGFIENICILADIPISIDKNPNCDWISIDHFTFRNTYLLPLDPNGASVRIASGIVLTNVVFEGTNAWVKGKYGLYWDDTETKGVSSNLSVKNVRMEQGAAPGGEIIHISHNYSLQNLVLENIYGCSGGVGGIYLRKCVNVTLQNIFYTEVNTPKGHKPAALDIDESSSNIVLINAFWNAGLVKTGKLIKTFGANSNPAKYDNRLIEVYDRPNNEQGEGLVLYGTKTWCYSGELADGAALSLPVGAGLGTKVATITVSATDGSAINESGCFMVGAKGTTIKVAGTDSIAITSTEGCLCLVPGTKVQLINHLGTKLDIVINLCWR